MSEHRYRNNVCAVIRNGNSVLVCHRIDSPPEEGWQFPQGGLESEDPAELEIELKRELREEIGNDRIRVVRILPGWYQYDLPEDQRISKWGGKFLGQRQKWVLCEFTDSDPALDYNTYCEPEFDSSKWVSPEEALENIALFKKDVYDKALRDLGLIKN